MRLWCRYALDFDGFLANMLPEIKRGSGREIL
jgi:hypothetical protein